MKYLKRFEVLTASAPKDYRDDYRVHQAYKDGYFHDMSEKYLDEFVYGIFRLFNENGVLPINDKLFKTVVSYLEMKPQSVLGETLYIIEDGINIHLSL